MTQSSPVTLITGDKVVLTTLSNGQQSVTLAKGATTTGVSGAYHATRENGDVYVWPADLQPYVGTVLSKELFNVSKLVREGYGDKSTATIPIIVDYQPAASTASTLPAAMSRTQTLSSINAVAGRASKRTARSFGQQLRTQLATGTLRGGALAGIKKIFLDEKLTVALADSVPQIGAPLAWAAGYDGAGVKVAVLDTGIDTTHPDLAGKVADQMNFTTDPDAVDHFGHGTHVADTVAGSGAASGGLRKGVAPGATLMNGKVLDSTGNGQESWIIAGMQWAATSGANIITMSLQGGITDGSDPLAQAVNQLTTDDGVLFTIAAGNFGPGVSSLTTPGAADDALTVGAVSKQDVLADFSGRGPRAGGFGLKPDITAPGVDIIAARAAGTSLGTPIDQYYTMLSGTSMATPHVAGAAAILKQEYPSFTPAELKAALTSTAKPFPYSVFEEGTGRVDVGRAYSQKVYADNSPLDFGYFPYPHDADTPVTKTLTYANYTTSDVTLNLTTDVTGDKAGPAAPGLITLSADSVTVPAGGKASVDVTVDTRSSAPSVYGGIISAQNADGSVQLRTAIGFYDEPVRYNLTVDGIARDGTPARGISWIDVVNADDTTAFQQTVGLTNGPQTIRVPPGTYSVMGFLFTYDNAGVYATEASIAGNPELTVNGDTSYTADARPATEVLAHTPRPTAPLSWVIGTYRAGASNGSWESLLLTGSPINRIFAAPTAPVTMGDFGFRAKTRLVAPPLAVSVGKTKLNGFLASGTPAIDGKVDLPLVYTGYGKPEDFTGLDLHGKAALIQRGPHPPIGDPLTFVEKVQNAEAAGASAVVIYNDLPGLLLVSFGAPNPTIPVITLTNAEGQPLADQLTAGRQLTLHASGTAQSPYAYDVLFAEHGRIQDTHEITLNSSNTVRIDANYHAQVDGWTAGDARHGYPEWSNFSFDSAYNMTVPFARTEYVSTGPGSWFHVAWGSMDPSAIFQWSQQGPQVSYTSPGRWTENWFSQPQHPGIIKTYTGADSGEPVTRTGDTITGFIPMFMDSEGRWGTLDTPGDTAPFQLFENDNLIAEGTGFFGSYDVSPGPARYRAELDVTRTAPFWALSTRTHTLWAFRSQEPAAGVTEVQPVLTADYDLGKLDLLSRAKHGTTQKINVYVHRQQGAAPSTVTGATIAVSFDDGVTWTNVPVKNQGGGHFRVSLPNPDDAQFVSLRVDASDNGGSRIRQTIVRAYGLN